MEAVKINFNLIPQELRKLLISNFAENFDRFWADPKNEAEFQEWRRQKERSSEARQA